MSVIKVLMIIILIFTNLLSINLVISLLEDCKKQNEEIERLNNIIKEVRENINKKLNVNSDYVDYDFGTELLRQELLEILDKGE